MLVFLQVSFLVNLACKVVLFGWRISLGIQGVLGLILVLGMMLLPETPRYRPNPLVNAPNTL